MNFLDIVTLRQSTRGYQDTPIKRDVLNRCLEAARLAPSACNSQPWKFIVVQGELKNRIFKAAFSGIYSMNKFIKDAPVFIVVIREKSKYVAELAGSFRGVEYSLIDIGIACEHLILQAQEEGLGTCWLGWFNERAVKGVLNLSKNSKVDVVISVGYPQSKGARDKNRKNFTEIVEFRE